MKIDEINMMVYSDHTLVVSEAEEKLVNKINSEIKISTISLPREIPGRVNNFSNREDIIFIGGFQHQPNVDAINYFLEEIWPLIIEIKPEIRLLIIGSNVPESFSNYEINYRNVILKGYVRDLTPIFSTCRLSIAPLRYGAGVKGKIVTSLSHGVPCIATSIAVEGMGLTDNENISIAGSPIEFKEKVVDLYTNLEKWERLSENGLNFTKENFSIEKIKGEFVKVLGNLGLNNYG